MVKLISARPIAESVWQLTDPFENRAYVVAGRERALLVDTMAGFGDVLAQASELAGGLPVTVVLTHRHCDHVGGSFGAGEVLMSAADDVEAAWEESERGARLFAEVARREGMVPDGEKCAVERGGRPRVSHVGEGDALDLGGRTVDVVELAGHTVGSVGYLVRDAGLLLSGDAVTPVMCLCFAESLTLDAWRQTLAKMAGLDFTAFWTGHHDVPFGKDSLGGFAAAADFAEDDRGHEWHHSIVPGWEGTIHLVPNGVWSPDSPDFRAVITRGLPPARPRRAGRRRAE